MLSNLGLITLLDDDLRDPDRNLQPISIREVKIYGNSYCGEKIDEFSDSTLRNIPKNGSFKILLNHFGIEGQMKNIPGQSKPFLEKKLKPYIDYLGTGHFHKQYCIESYIFNPGCLSPACLSDFNLPHGYFLVEVDKARNYHIQITKKQVPERKILWKSITLKSKPINKQNLYSFILNFLGRDITAKNLALVNNQQWNLPVLCLTLNSPSGKIISSATKKELRTLILNNFHVVECHLFQKQINYKPIEKFFPMV